MNKEEQKLFSIISDKMKDLAKILKSINTGIEQTKCQFYKYKINDLAKTITYEDLGFVKTILNNVINQQGLPNKPWNTRSLYDTEGFDFNDVNFLTLAQTKNLYDFLDATFNGESFHKIVNDFVENVYEDDYDLHEYHGTSFFCCNIKNEKQLYDIINTDWSGPKNLFSVIPEYVDFALNDGKVEFHFNNIYKEIFSFTCEGNTIQTFSDGKPGKTFEFNSKNIQLVLHDVYDYAANIEKDFYSNRLHNFLSTDDGKKVVKAFCQAINGDENLKDVVMPDLEEKVLNLLSQEQLENITVFLGSLSKENFKNFADKFTKDSVLNEENSDVIKLLYVISQREWFDKQDFLKILPADVLPCFKGADIRFGMERDKLNYASFTYEKGKIRTYIAGKTGGSFEEPVSGFSEKDLQDIKAYMTDKLALRIPEIMIETIVDNCKNLQELENIKNTCLEKISNDFEHPLTAFIKQHFFSLYEKNEKIQGIVKAAEAIENNKVNALEEM